MKGYEKSSHKVCIFCAETVKTCVAASENVFRVSVNVLLLLAIVQCLVKNVRLPLKRYQWTTASKRKCAAASEYIFFYAEDCVAASKNISMLYNESAASSKRYRWTTASEIYY